MRSAKSNPALNNNNNNYINVYNRNQQQQQSPDNSMNHHNQLSNNWTTLGANGKVGAGPQPAADGAGPTSPICRCRVMYLGSSVPLITKDGLQGIQEPLRKLYPFDKGLAGLDQHQAGGSVGIDSWLSVWSNGILIENVDDNGREMKRFFKIGALHYCAAVKYIPAAMNTNSQIMYSCSTLPANNNPSALMQQQQLSNLPRFLPLDSPYARQTGDSSPPIFASILRRTTGIKVLECHAFICKREAAANALVRCCFHAYADTMYAKQIGADVNSLANDDANDNSGTSFQETEHDFGATQEQDHPQRQQQQNHNNHHSLSNSNESNRLISRSRSKSIAALNETSSNQQHQLDYRASKDSTNDCYANGSGPDPEYCSLADNQHSAATTADGYSINGRKSSVEQYPTRDELDWNGNTNNNNKLNGSNLKKQQKLSKSMHYLNYQQTGIGPSSITNGGFINPIHLMNAGADGNAAYPMMINPCFSNVNTMRTTHADNLFWTQKQSPNSLHHQQQQPFYNNPYASRVPSYPPQEQVDSANGGGTLKSIRSMAANSIASTLLRSKRHAKSMAQLNKDKVISFHQPQANHHHHHIGSAHTMMSPPVMLPPVPPMFLPNLPHAGGGGIINGSQTMKLPSRSMVPMMMGQPMNFEAMTPKEMKKLLKKSAKYGIPPPPLPPQNLNPLAMETNGLPMLPLPRQTAPSSHFNGDGTLPLRPPSIYSDVFNGGGGGYADMSPDMAASMHGLPPPTMEQQQQQQVGPILVKPNQEFLKSKAGKKWLKQQKEFKKLLPPHLDGLPIIFGPPPPDALEPHTGGSAPGRNHIVPGCDNSIDNRQRIYY